MLLQSTRHRVRDNVLNRYLLVCGGDRTHDSRGSGKRL